MLGDYCGCCGVPLRPSEDKWCDLCLPHISLDRRLSDEYRTYFGQHGSDCPYQATGGATIEWFPIGVPGETNEAVG